MLPFNNKMFDNNNNGDVFHFCSHKITVLVIGLLLVIISIFSYVYFN